MRITARTLYSLTLGASVAVAAYACGGSDKTNNGSGSGDGDGDGDITIGLGGGGGTGGTDDPLGDGKSYSGQGCAEYDESSSLEPVYLVFLLDQSGSMGDGQNGDRTEKWDPVTEAMESFFAEPASAGIYASLTLFPTNLNKTNGAASSSYGTACDASDYSTPVVSPTLLPNDEVFAAAIAAVDPPNEYGTPTYPALSGTIDYAQTLLAEGKKVAIVMVTDGEPFSCSGNNITNTAQAAASVADTIPTYVLGVGNQLSNLNSIAASGGTEEAFLVDTSDPTQTRDDLLAQIQLIRGQQVSCELALPDPPQGQTLDPNKVNVEYTVGGKAVPLGFNEDCSGGTGWHYDSNAAPSQVLLCSSTCDTVKASDDAAVNVVFGCETNIILR